MYRYGKRLGIWKTKKRVRELTETPIKKKALSRTVLEIQKAYGQGAIMRLSDNTINMQMSVIPTGSIGLDLALGVGGLPKGRIIEIYGPESSGKTTLALHAISEVQKQGGVAVFIDAEHALDPQYAAAVGVNTGEMYISQPDTGEQALQITDLLISSGAIDIVVIDSVAALVPQAEIDGEMGQSHMGLHARLMSQALRKLTGTVSRANCIIIFINQLREKIGIMYGNPETTTGGRALKFYSSVRIDIRRIETIKDGENAIGNHVRAKVVKNKIAPPFRNAEFDIIFGKGISRYGEILEIAINLKLIQKSGSWFYINDERIAQGRENARNYLEAHPEVSLRLESEIRKANQQCQQRNDKIGNLNQKYFSS